MEAVRRFARTAFFYEAFMGAKIGTVGPRPAPFETCAINEDILIEKFRQKAVPINLLTLYSDQKGLGQTKEIDAIISQIEDYYHVTKIDQKTMVQLAKLESMLEKYACEQGLLGMGIQYGLCGQKEVPHFIDWTIAHQKKENTFLPGTAGMLLQAYAGRGPNRPQTAIRCSGASWARKEAKGLPSLN